MSRNDDDNRRTLVADTLSWLQIERTPPPVLYAVALVVVTAAMVLLPVLYAALIACVAYATYWHLTNDTWILQGTGVVLVNVLAYFGPAVAAAILFFFMVKPFFARSAEPESFVSLDAEREPVIFGLIERICTTIGARMPVIVRVDCRVNAGASLVGGPLRLFRRRLVLTLGLPLAASLTTQQFTGVLAHEFGHFAQGTGMRLSYAILSINRWFWRVVHERDEWDVLLNTWSQRADVRIRIVFWLARGAVLCTRRVLWGLMMLGHLISCLMLRAMEYDADSYAIKVIGSDAFSETLSRLRALNIVEQFAYGDVRQSWLGGTLPDDFPALVANKVADLQSELIEKASSPPGAGEHKWLATHPSTAQRIEAARRMARPGIFTRSDPAPELFADFSGLCRAASRHHYERTMHLNISGVQFIDTNQVMLDSRQAGAALDALLRFFADGMNVLRPVLIDSSVRRQTADLAGAWESLDVARVAMKDIASSSATLRKRFAELGDKKMRAMAARALIEAGYDVEPGQLGAFESTTAAADAAISRASAEQDLAAIQLYPYENHVRQRITAALDILESGGSNGSASFSDLAQHASTITRVLAVMNRAHGAAATLWCRITVSDLVIVHARTRPNRERLNTYLRDLENVLRKLVDEVRRHVSDTPYPFASRGVQRSLCDYLRGSDVTTKDIGALLRDARAHAKLFFELYLRVVAEIALIVEQVEASRVAAV